MTAAYSYDALGRRISKTVSGATTGFAYDGGNFAQEKNASGTPTANLLTGGTDQTFSRTDGAGARYFLTDALGSTVGLVDTAGAIQTSYTYEPFGKTTTTGAASANSQQFTSRENDGPLYYYRARYYNPTFARFISEDPAGFAAGDYNVYRYAGDSPTNVGDPSGEIAPIVAACVGGAVFSVVFDLISNALGHRKTTLGDIVGSAAGGCVAGVAGFGLGKALQFLTKPVTEGIYQVVAKSGLTYVGQSSNIAARLAQHVASGKITQEAADNALRWAVSGGKTAREIAEQLRINELGGVAGLENIVNPIGAARKGLLQTFESVDEYLQYLDHLIR